MKSNYSRIVHIMKTRSITRPKHKVGGARRASTGFAYKASNDRHLTGTCVTIYSANETHQ